MNWKQEWKRISLIVIVFLGCFFLPIGSVRFDHALMEALRLVKWYAREHVLLCLVPAFFIAGAIGVFISQAAVMKYLGARANKVLAYGVASVSGSILAVCSCTVLPLFAGIWRMGAGLGPACAFLYSGPAINVLAIILTARILGLQIGIARAVGAISFSIIIGLLMHLIFRKEELEKAANQAQLPEPEVKRPLWQNAVFFAVMVGLLVFANWGAPNNYLVKLANGQTLRVAMVKAPEDPSRPGATYTLKLLAGPKQGSTLQVPSTDLRSRTAVSGTWTSIWRHKWWIASGFAILLALVLVSWFGVKWWKLVLAGLVPLALLLLLPTHGPWVMLPFAAGVLGLSIALGTDRGDGNEWLAASWGFAKQILPLLLFGVVIAGFLLGRPGHEGMIPARYVRMLVGDTPDTFLAITGLGPGIVATVIREFWPLWTNLFASIFGAFMYFATLTEVPILQGLIGAGMGKGPALALLLAGPALSLPNMLVIRSVLGTRKTVVFVSLVVVMATISGMVFAMVFG